MNLLPSDEQLISQLKEHYCLTDSRGNYSTDKIMRCVEAFRQSNKKQTKPGAADYPDVNGIPRLSFRITKAGDISAAAHKFYDQVHNDPQLLQLSFKDPLYLATEILGIEVTPLMARLIRTKLRKVVPFHHMEKPANSDMGITKIKWILKN